VSFDLNHTLMQIEPRIQPRVSGIAKHYAPLILIALAVFAIFLRCSRLLDTTRYYIFGTDSYFFHWVAQRVMDGQGPPPDTSGANYTVHSGLAYPLAYLSKMVAYVFRVQDAQALTFMSKFLPPVLGVITLILIYLVVSKIWNRRVGLFSAFAWAIMLHTVFLGNSGLIDRDGLNILLFTIGALVFHMSRGWHFRVGKRDVAWLLAGLLILVVELLLYLEWVTHGAALLVLFLTIYVVLRLAMRYIALLRKEPNLARRIVAAGRAVDLRVFALIIVVNLVVIFLNYQQAHEVLQRILDIIRLSTGEGATGIASAETQGATLISLLVAYQLFIIPMALGLYVTVKYRNDWSVFFSTWLVFFLLAGVVAFRLLFFAAPAACVVSAIGLDYLWNWRRQGNSQLAKSVAFAVLLVLLFSISILLTSSMNSEYRTSANSDWQGAMTYLKDQTPEDAIVMTQYTHGYWILDMAQREPFVDPGYYASDAGKLQDVATAYATTDPSEAATIMTEREVSYLIFARHDLSVARFILSSSDLYTEYDAFPVDSLIARSINGEFVSGSGLSVVYKNDEVVILYLEQAGQK